MIVHEWNDHQLVRRIGEHRDRVGGYRLLFHDTHHRSVSDRSSMVAYDLSNYDGVLAFGNVIRDIYLTEGWTQHAWTWHEAADTRIFHPIDDFALGATSEKSESSKPNEQPNNPKSRALLKVGGLPDGLLAIGKTSDPRAP